MLMPQFTAFGIMALHVILYDSLKLLRNRIAFQSNRFLAIHKYRCDRHFSGAGQADADISQLDSPGPFTTQPITATLMDSTPGYWLRQSGICSRR